MCLVEQCLAPPSKLYRTVQFSSPVEFFRSSIKCGNAELKLRRNMPVIACCKKTGENEQYSGLNWNYIEKQSGNGRWMWWKLLFVCFEKLRFVSLPDGSPPPLGDKFVQKIEWFICPPPLKFNAGASEMIFDTSSIIAKEQKNRKKLFRFEELLGIFSAFVKHLGY